MLAHVLLSYFIRVVYVIDLILGFRKAYIDERVGAEIRDPKVIAKSYLKFYFWVDFLSAVPFDLFSRSFALYCVQLLKIVRLFRLGQIITYLNASTQTQSRMRLLYILMRFFIIIHWTSCLFYYQLNHNYENQMKKDPNLEPKYNYWFLVVDVGAALPNYYQQTLFRKYYIMFYNCILLIIGNDINPQTDREVLLCLTMIILGAFIEAYIIGGITTEMSKGQH